MELGWQQGHVCWWLQALSCGLLPGGCQLSCSTAGCRLADLLKHCWLQPDTCRHHNPHNSHSLKPVHYWLQLLSCGPREHEKVAAVLQDDRRQSVKVVKALEEELAAMQAAALVRDGTPGQQELPVQQASSRPCPGCSPRSARAACAAGKQLASDAETQPVALASKWVQLGPANRPTIAWHT